MSQSSREPLWRSLVISIVPLFFGSLLFAGILESYKNDASARKEIMNDFYRPMRETQSGCQKTHNNLFLGYAKLAGSYRLMLDEFKHLTTLDMSRMTRDYEILLESMLSTHATTTSDTKRLEVELEACRAKLFRQYEELALVTGTYDQFKGLSRDRATRLNDLYAKRKALADQTLRGYDINSLMGMLRDFLQFNFENQEQKTLAAQKVNELGEPIIQHYLQLSNSEQDMFKIDAELFEGLHTVFAKDISSRFERGFIARNFF
ncbi:hypothetical protein [Bordetella petrii]|uniref:hypothetical protein n=1 Tax=Bordetella petrii TaxID=94624 RepID=UPI0037339AB8